ncbi:MAG: 7-carboxy-7-deazaguanine synthase QueE [Thermoleophilia bacterium]|jgi:organic radical activating enzyme
MTFVRLAGCNAAEVGLECVRWCDTPDSRETTAGRAMKVGDIMAQVRLPRLCLTGGEPLLQLDGVAGLISAAAACRVVVHIETNGTVSPLNGRVDGSSVATRPIASRSKRSVDRLGDGIGADRPVWMTVSPKPPAYLIAEGWEGLVDELKFVVDDGFDEAIAVRLAGEHPGAVVSIQPRSAPSLSAGATGLPVVGSAPLGCWSADGPTHEAVERAVDLVMEHPDWRLSLQTHKLLGIR